LGILYVYEGHVVLSTDEQNILFGSPQAVAISGHDKMNIQASGPARFLFLSAPLLDQPVVIRGSFIMNSDAQVIAAIDRYERGEMGRMKPLTLD
jgi:redox-sensitive bicupin YhaK (pirin superfamily)